MEGSDFRLQIRTTDVNVNLAALLKFHLQTVAPVCCFESELIEAVDLNINKLMELCFGAHYHLQRNWPISPYWCQGNYNAYLHFS